jgi:hypothetical protein
MPAPTSQQLDILSETARVAHMMGETFDAARALAEQFALSPDATGLINADMSTSESGIMQNLDLSHVTTLLAGISSIADVAAANSNALRKATYALSARNIV